MTLFLSNCVIVDHSILFSLNFTFVISSIQRFKLVSTIPPRQFLLRFGFDIISVNFIRRNINYLLSLQMSIVVSALTLLSVCFYFFQDIHIIICSSTFRSRSKFRGSVQSILITPKLHQQFTGHVL